MADKYYSSLYPTLASEMGLPSMIDERQFSLFSGKMEWVDNEAEDTETKPVQEKAVKAEAPVDSKALAGLVAEALNDIQLKDFEPIPFSKMINAYLAFANYENKKTEKAYRNEFLCFIDVYGDMLSTDITRIMITKYRDLLVKLPKQAKLKYPDTPLIEVAAMGFPKGSLVGTGTVDKYIDRLSRMFDWAVDNSHMAANLTPNMKTDKDDVKKKVPFDTAGLQQYFMNSPVHQDRLTTGQKMEMFWTPLIALFSAARIEEICSLQITGVYLLKDDRRGDEAWVFDLNRGEGIKSLKNAPAIRHTSIHSELIKIGFLDYFEGRKRNSCQALWNLSPNSGRKNDRCSQFFGKRHATYLNNTVGITDKKKAFHFFRHTAIHALRESSGLREDYFRAIIGHGQEGTTGKDYFAQLGVAVLQPTIEGVKYPQLDLSHLYQE